ncbi:unnamed protein product, partial [Amoebophrya sp. A25]|eukprot:GSA25T00000278001.1
MRHGANIYQTEGAFTDARTRTDFTCDLVLNMTKVRTRQDPRIGFVGVNIELKLDA